MCTSVTKSRTMEVMQVEPIDDKYEPSIELNQISFPVTYTTQCRNRQHNRNSGASADKVEGENWTHAAGESYKFEEECKNSKEDKYDFNMEGNWKVEEQDGPSCLTDESLSDDTESTLKSDGNVAKYCPKVVPTSKRTDRAQSRRKCKKIKKSDQNIKQLEKVLKETRKDNTVILNIRMPLLQFLTTIGLTSEQSSTAISNLIKTEQHFEVNKTYSNVKPSGNSRKHSSKQNKKTTSKDLDIINISNSLGFQLVVPTCLEISSNIARCLLNIHKLVYPMDMFIQSRDSLCNLEYVRFVRYGHDVECEFEKYKHRKIDTYPSNVSFRKNLFKSEFSPNYEVMASIQLNRVKVTLLSAVCSIHLTSKLFFQQNDVRPLIPFYNLRRARLPKVIKLEQYFEVNKKQSSAIENSRTNKSKQNKKATSKDLGIINIANSIGLRLVVSICSEGSAVLTKRLMNVHKLVYPIKMSAESMNSLHGLEYVRFVRCGRVVECEHYNNQKNDTYYSNMSFKKNLCKSELCQQHEVMASIQTNRAKSILISSLCSLHLRSNLLSQQNNVRLLMPIYNPLGCYNPASKMPELVVPPKTNSPKNNRPTGKKEKVTQDSKGNKKTSGRRLLNQDDSNIERREKSEHFRPNMSYMRQHVTSLNSNKFSVFGADAGVTDNSVQRCANQCWDYICHSEEESCKSGSSERGILYTGIEERSEVCDIHEFDRQERVDGTNSQCQDRILNIHPTDDNNERTEMCTSVTKSLMCRNCIPFVGALRTPLEGGTFGNITLRNTCCIDGFLLLVFNVLDADIDLRNQFTNSNNKVPELHSMFYGIWEHFHDYNFDIAKVVWCDYGGLLSINDATDSVPVTVDVTGSENDRIFCVLGKERLAVERVCTNTVCPNATVASTDLYRVLPIYEKEGESLCDTIMKELRNYLQRDISPCQFRQSYENHCSGSITQTIVDPPLIVPVNLFFLKFGKKRYISTDIPDTVECNEQSYELRMVRFYIERISHFVDKIKIGNNWTYYDNGKQLICYFDEDPNDVQLSSCYYILVKSQTPK